MSAPVFRFAPSPNGYLHAGHAYSALLNGELAQEMAGTFLLRIEDIDRARATRVFEDAIYDDLTWLGLSWPRPVRRQSRHFADYHRALDALAAQGLLYPCFCTRGQIAATVAGHTDWPHDPDGSPLYPGTCRGLTTIERDDRISAGESYALRIDMPAAVRAVSPTLLWREWSSGDDYRDVPVDAARWGDVVLARRDIGTSYHIAVVADDALQGVTHVVRGGDLFEATHIHRILQTLLGLPAPLYRHHAIVRDQRGDKLAKSRESLPLRVLRAQGVTARMIRDDLGL